MRNVYGLFLLAYWACILLIPNYKGYSELVSDWSKVKNVDYATNRPLANYYNSTNAKWLRTRKDVYEINQKVSQGDTVTIGIDYYNLYFPVIQIDDEMAEALKHGYVYYIILPGKNE